MFLRGVFFCLLASLVMILAGLGAGHVAWWYAAGLLQSAALLPFLLHGPAAFWKRLLSIWCLFTAIGVFCLWTEAVIFIRATQAERVRDLVGAFVIYSIFSLSIALAALMVKPQRGEDSHPVHSYSTSSLMVRVFGCGLSYLACYYVFGAIVFFLFTKPYYTGAGPLADAQKMALSLGWWFPLIQIGRGVLMTLGILPIVLGTRISRLRASIYIGILVWVIGGVAPLMVPSAIMPAELRLMHIGEIFTQNFPLGMIAVFLLRRKEGPLSSGLKGAPVEEHASING
jgi:hypothetical protein